MAGKGDEKIRLVVLLYYIRPVSWLLVGKKGVCNLWPQRMAGKGDEEIRLVVLLYYIRPVLWLLVGKKGVCNSGH